MVELSPDLLKHLPDAELEVLSWSAASGELAIRIRKEFGGETGILRFSGVGKVNLPPRFTVASLKATARSDGDTFFEFAEAWGESYFVLAETAHYEAGV